MGDLISRLNLTASEAGIGGGAIVIADGGVLPAGITNNSIICEGNVSYTADVIISGDLFVEGELSSTANASLTVKGDTYLKKSPNIIDSGIIAKNLRFEGNLTIYTGTQYSPEDNYVFSATSGSVVNVINAGTIFETDIVNSDFNIAHTIIQWTSGAESGNIDYAFWDMGFGNPTWAELENGDTAVGVGIGDTFDLIKISNKDIYLSAKNKGELYVGGKLTIVPSVSPSYNFMSMSMTSSDTNVIFQDGNDGTRTLKINNGIEYVIDMFGVSNYADQDYYDDLGKALFLLDPFSRNCHAEIFIKGDVSNVYLGCNSRNKSDVTPLSDDPRRIEITGNLYNCILEAYTARFNSGNPNFPKILIIGNLVNTRINTGGWFATGRTANDPSGSSQPSQSIYGDVLGESYIQNNSYTGGSSAAYYNTGAHSEYWKIKGNIKTNSNAMWVIQGERAVTGTGGRAMVPSIEGDVVILGEFRLKAGYSTSGVGGQIWPLQPFCYGNCYISTLRLDVGTGVTNGNGTGFQCYGNMIVRWLYATNTPNTKCYISAIGSMTIYQILTNNAYRIDLSLGGVFNTTYSSSNLEFGDTSNLYITHTPAQLLGKLYQWNGTTVISK